MDTSVRWAGLSLRRARRELVGIVILLALLGGVSLFALAGARRTQSAYPRFLRHAHASTMAVDPGQYSTTENRRIAHLPGVVRSTTYVGFYAAPLVHGRPDLTQDFEALGTFDGRFFTMDRFAPTRGRLSNPARQGEMVVNETAARRYGYSVGQVIDLGIYARRQVEDEEFGRAHPDPMIRRKVTIVGIGLFTDEVVQDDTNRTPLALLTPALSRRASAYATYAWQALALEHGDADVAAVKAGYLARYQNAPDFPQFFRVTSVDTFHVEQAVRPLSLALGSFGFIAAAAGLVLVAQAIGRTLSQARLEQDVLRAFGAAPSSLAALALIGPLLALAVGALAAAVVAFLASPLMPIGATRRVEVHHGLDADWTVLGLGALAFFVPLAVAATAVALRQLPHRRSATRRLPRRSRLVTWSGRSGLPPSVVAGLRLAFEPGEGATAVPVRSVMVAGAVAVTTLVASLTFGSSFHALLDEPELYGWNWGVAVYDSGGYGFIDEAQMHEALDGRPGIAGWSGAYFGADTVEDLNLPLLGMEPSSAVHPPILRGRMTRSADEIVLGTATARTLHKGLGDTVQVGVGQRVHRLRVVGLATLPSIGLAHGAHTSLGVGAVVAPDLVPGIARQQDNGSQVREGPPVVFVGFTRGADPVATRAVVYRATRQIGQFPGGAQVLGAQRPAEIVNSGDVGGAPAFLATALGLSAALSLAFALAASVRRRQHELALLRSIGFTRRQLRTSVAWQATSTIGVGLMVGLPLGVALGRTLWITFARQLDVVPHPTIPLGAMLLVALAGLVVANLAAALPARRAGRVRAAIVLRSE